MGMFDELQASLVGALNTYGTKPANAAANWWNEMQSFTQQQGVGEYWAFLFL